MEFNNTKLNNLMINQNNEEYDIYNPWVLLDPVPNWVNKFNDIMDFGFSSSLTIKTIYNVLNYSSLVDIMQKHKFINVPGKYSNFVDFLGYAFIGAETAIDIYSNLQQGHTKSYVISSAMYTAGTGIITIIASEKIGFCIGTLVGNVPGAIVGSIVGLFVGLILDKGFDYIKEEIFN